MTNPTQPVYIVSKGRHESMHTSRSLNRMGVDHYIAIEPQDEENYENALDEFGLRDHVTLLILPFSNHGDGPGRARNWCWDHSIANDFIGHWVLDDNISDFYRLHKNKRIRVESGVIFKIAEDFIDRYENIPVSGFNYRFFVPPDSDRPPFLFNTRIYSCLYILNDCKHRWRGRYNEDTDLSLNVMKDGDVTCQFNIFLQGKDKTQTVKGGNSAEFYDAEGTMNKSQMLVDMHPDVCRLSWKYGRWHHHVDYSGFAKRNKPRFKPGVEESLTNEVNNYGLKLISNWQR
jgi:hypothetical protein